jgi:hypothetical protein
MLMMGTCRVPSKAAFGCFTESRAADGHPQMPATARANGVAHARSVLRKFPDTPTSLGAIDGLDTATAPNGAGHGTTCAGKPLGNGVFVAAMLEKKISRFEKENLSLTTLLQDVTGQGLAAITSHCRQPVFGWESQVLHPEVLRACTDRLGLSLRLMCSACADQDYVTEGAMDAISMQRLRLTKSVKGGFLRRPTDVAPAAWIAGVLKVLDSLPDRLLANGSTKPISPGARTDATRCRGYGSWR